jgi:hypothetical protein
MNAVRRWLAHPLIVIAMAVIYIVSQSMIAHTLQQGGAEALLFRFQFCYQADAFTVLLHSISDAQLNALQQHFAYDHMHPLWYGLLALSLTSWLLDLNALSARWNLLLWPAVLMSVLDVVENSIHEPWFNLLSTPSDPWVMIAGFSATLKWTLAALYLSGALALTIRYVSLRKTRQPNA